METFFASPERLSDSDLQKEIEIVSNHSVIDGLLHSVSGLLAILNEHRQILALNESLMEMLGITDAGQALGLRSGEAVNCIHAHETEAGCGTSKYCSTCGAAIAIVTSLGENKPVERTCALSVDKKDKPVDIFLLIKAQPIIIKKKRFLLLFLQDNTEHQQRAALERTFFHDINNMLGKLIMASQLLKEENPSDLAEITYQVSQRLSKEVDIQRYLLRSGDLDVKAVFFEVTIEKILNELQSFFANHPVAHEKNITISKTYPVVSIKTDISLLLRVLYNMVTNAFEATPQNGTVKVWIENEDNYVSFCVWNNQEIPQEITKRIFQRNFSTKEEAGRGIGTFSMKLLGEKVLGGKVNFSTFKSKGTIFKFSIPT
jgi:K+-sensing histidine kinase KdpD